jgi:hypothetical protein
MVAQKVKGEKGHHLFLIRRKSLNPVPGRNKENRGGYGA